ncbi:MAG TPA: aminodeoxychorismate synthase component I [Streptosporangiaceae bacterium]|nr:aminodeoxychorismate synthase component I [Streptosporangiaceae bacterium]
MTYILLDNYDSFTYNLYQALANVVGRPPVVVTNDDEAGLSALDLGEVQGIIISPGPGNPAVERDFGLSRWAVEQSDIPVLGICLGHQGLCLNAGGRVDLAPTPMHGRPSDIVHNGDRLFDGIPSPFSAMRYHSLLVYDLPDEIEAIARTVVDGLLMGARHLTKPQWGIQFHPESIATEFGERLLGNFVRACSDHAARTVRRAVADAALARAVEPGADRYRLHVREVGNVVAVDALFDALFGSDKSAFWLDSAQPIAGLSRFSLLGSSAGPLGERLVYNVDLGQVEVFGSDGSLHERFDGEILTYLAGKVPSRRVPGSGLPVQFALGYVGYLGYELKTAVGGSTQHRSPTPDAQFIFADRGVVIDHEESRVWLLTLSRESVDGQRWLDEAESVVQRLQPLPDVPPAAEFWSTPAVRARHSNEEYLALITEAQRLISLGESYEVCLTNMFEVDCTVDPWSTYRRLRAVNPAPFGALLKFPGLDVLSSSPERFMRIGTDRVAESKPIKGTCRRGSSAAEDRMLAIDLAMSEKERAENIMIVDLVRNDIGRTAEVGSVFVPVLCGVESYQTVHQLVSTIRGTIRADSSPAECVRNAFPGGSMTGAPKLRTMEIIDRLEAGPRGVYSGAIGYFSLDGAADLSITIRTIVIAENTVSIGVGGAITALSDPTSELQEIWLKAEAMLITLGQETGAQRSHLISAATE